MGISTARVAIAVLAVTSSFILAAPATQPATTKIVVHADAPGTDISPWIYGTNQPNDDPPSRYTLVRQGGNRMTAYNWENNASNAGNDWHHQNDNNMSASDTPGEAVRVVAAKALANGQSFISTVPMTDYVAADKRGDGDVKDSGPDYLTKRFKRNVPMRPGAAVPGKSMPDVSDDTVSQEEFVGWLERTFPAADRQAKTLTIGYALDNEPDLWSNTHARIHAGPLTFAELIDRNARFGAMVKKTVPEAPVFGFVSYGWGGFTTLQNAPDGAGRDVVDVYLDAMKKAEADAGHRVIDVLDLHWYSEARGGGTEQTGVRVSEASPRANEPAVNAARMQATRSLWDPTYREVSWINRVLGEPIRLIARIKAKIDAHYPGTKLAFTEYNYGGGENISGAIAEADALGIFGREGVFAAAFWALSEKEPFSRAGFDAYRNYDGKGGAFGEKSLRVENPDAAMLGVYASHRQGDGAAVLVVTNQSTEPRAIQIDVRGAKATNVGRWQLTSEKPAMVPAEKVQLDGSALSVTVPALSVTTLELK